MSLLVEVLIIILLVGHFVNTPQHSHKSTIKLLKPFSEFMFTVCVSIPGN